MDPVTAIRQQYELLLQQGRTLEADQLTQEFLVRRAQQTNVTIRKAGEGNSKSSR